MHNEYSKPETCDRCGIVDTAEHAGAFDIVTVHGKDYNLCPLCVAYDEAEAIGEVCNDMPVIFIKPKLAYRNPCYPPNEMDTEKVYAAVPARNQPDWEKRGAIFAGNHLLERREYTIVRNCNVPVDFDDTAIQEG